MKTLRLISIVFLFTLLATACGREACGRMDIADSLMTERPDSALEILRSVTPEMRSGRAQEARYDMLLTDALYRCEADSLLSDSVIGVATDYYQRRDDAPAAARAHYLAGIVDAFKGNRGKSITHLLHAEKYALRDSANHFQLALVYRQLGDGFWEADDMASALKYHRLSYREFTKADKATYAAYALYSVTASYLMLDNKKEFMEHLDMALPMAREIGDSELIGVLTSLKGVYCYQSGLYDEAICIFNEMRDSGGYFTQRELYYLGLCYFELNDMDKTKRCQSLMAETPPSYSDGKDYDLQEYIYIQNGNYKEAYHSLENEIERLNNITSSIWNRDVRGVIDSYYKTEENHIRQELSNSRLLILIIALSAVFLTAGLLIYLRLRYVSSKRKQSDFMLRIASLKEDLSMTGERVSELELALDEKTHALDEKTHALTEASDTVTRISAEMECARLEIEEKENINRNYESQILEMHQHIRKALAGRYKVLEDLYCRYCLSPAVEKQSEIYKEIYSQIEKLKDNRKTVTEIENLINECFNGLIKDFKTDFPKLSKDDRLLYIYSLSGLSTNSLSVIFKLKPNALYQRKDRLKKKLGDHASRNGICYSDLL